MPLVEKCICGSEDFTKISQNGIDCNRCDECGIIHQIVEKTEEEYHAWYAENYMDTVYTHTYGQDREAAAKRLDAYGSKLGRFTLDFGCGNGAFLDACLHRSYDAVGLDLHAPKGKDKFYTQPIEDVKFPSGYFSSIVANDVLEHLVDPRKTLKELARALEDGGCLIVDFPAFFEPEGKKHWKKVEHLWMLDKDAVIELVEAVGFTLDSWFEPIPGKYTFIFKKNFKKRKTILLPPGIGDTYWCLAKIESMCEVEGFEDPAVYIASTKNKRDRSEDYVKRFPFLTCEGYYNPGGGINRHPIWRKAYFEDGDGVFRDVFDFDYFISANGPFRFNKTLDEIMPQWKTNWYPEMFVSAHERNVADYYSSGKPYIVVFFTGAGPYKRWFAEYPAEEVVKTLKYFTGQGFRVLFTGAAWDTDDTHYQQVVNQCTTPMFEDLRGKTTLAELMGLLRGATGVFGHAAGNTIMGTVLKKPTVILWNDYFNKLFYTATCPPDSLHNWYEAIDTKEHTHANPGKTLLRLIKQNT